MQCGGATKMKKMQKGGSAEIVGMPKYGNNPRTEQGRILKKGGSVAFAPNRAVQASCKNGTVRDENGKCVMMRKMGGAANDKYQYGGSKGSTKKPMLMSPAKINVTPGKKPLTYNDMMNKLKKKTK